MNGYQSQILSMINLCKQKYFKRNIIQSLGYLLSKTTEEISFVPGSKNKQLDEYEDDVKLKKKEKKQEYSQKEAVRRSEMLSKAMMMNPEDTHILQLHKYVDWKKLKVTKLSLWDSLLTWGKKKQETNFFLLDRSLGKKIGQAIEKNHTGNKETLFFDCDGSLGLVSSYILKQRCFSSVKVFERDKNYRRVFGSQLLNMYKDRLEYFFFNINVLPLLMFKNNDIFVRSLKKFVDHQEWSGPPPFTLFSIVNISFTKYLLEALYRHELDPDKGDIFYFGRAEFFLIVSARSYFFLTSDKSVPWTYRPHTVMFQLLFDYKLLSPLPRRSFIPYKDTKPKRLEGRGSSKIKTKINDVGNQAVFFMYCKPKLNVGHNSKTTLLQLRHFVYG